LKPAKDAVFRMYITFVRFLGRQLQKNNWNMELILNLRHVEMAEPVILQKLFKKMNPIIYKSEYGQY